MRNLAALRAFGPSPPRYGSPLRCSGDYHRMNIRTDTFTSPEVLAKRIKRFRKSASLCYRFYGLHTHPTACITHSFVNFTSLRELIYPKLPPPHAFKAEKPTGKFQTKATHLLQHTTHINPPSRGESATTLDIASFWKTLALGIGRTRREDYLEMTITFMSALLLKATRHGCIVENL